MRSSLTILISLGLLALTGGVAFYVWREIGEVEISGHGLVALALGTVVSFALGAGLMALMFFSSRRGYDDRAHELDRMRDRSRRD